MLKYIGFCAMFCKRFGLALVLASVITVILLETLTSVASGDQEVGNSYSVSEWAYPSQYMPAVINMPVPTPTRIPTVIFLGQRNAWDGEGYIRSDTNFNVGTHTRREFDQMTAPDVIRSSNRSWYDPNPQGWAAESWYSYYSLSTSEFQSSSAIVDPAWKFSAPIIMPNRWSPVSGQTFVIEGNEFNVAGPLQGVTAFGKPVRYWQFTNRARILYLDRGGDWKQYVMPGELILRYDAGRTRLLLYENVLRRYFYQGQQTQYYVQYIDQLTSSNAFPARDSLAPTDNQAMLFTPLVESNYPLEDWNPAESDVVTMTTEIPPVGSMLKGP